MRTRGKVTIVVVVILLVLGGIGIRYHRYISQAIKFGFVVQSDNDSYEGIGQQKVRYEDGYKTTFTTYKGKVYKEYKQNGDASWAKNEYWEGTMADNGCGITAMAIILTGYGKDVTPETLREKYAPHLAGSKMKEAFVSYGIYCSDFYTDKADKSKESIYEHLDTDRPVLICVSSDLASNRWTNNSHYMALLACDGNKVYVSNPSGQYFYNKSGWYNFDEISSCIAKVMYVRS